MSAHTIPGHVTVRMYNVGFGDAFLLILPDEDGDWRVLIDCGSHSASPRPRPLKEVVNQIIADVTDEETGSARIDVVVGTHRHQDHVSGFTQSGWADVEVGEVWLPWTEDPEDPEATRIREAQSSAARHLYLGLERLGADDRALGLALNSLTNEKAMRTLHAGFKGTPPRRFLPLPSSRASRTTRSIGPARVHVLGPSREPEVIRDMNPPAGESYLRLLGAAEEDASVRLPPFPAGWELATEKLEASKELAHLRLDQQDRERLAELAEVDGFALAVALEKAVNGTSLVLMFELGDAYLLFPGDAQWGTWKTMLDQPDTRKLLERTTFLKVGHHGSHNGTPKDFVEALEARQTADTPPDLWAMVSTHPIEMWKEIPKTQLLEGLRTATDRLARSDAGFGAPVGGFTRWDDAVIEARVPIH